MRQFPPYPKKKNHRGRARLCLDRKDYYLPGPHGSQESLDAYEALRTEWRTKGRLDSTRPTLHAGSITFAELAADFLTWSHLHQAAATYSGYGWFLERFAALHGKSPATTIRPIDVTRWVDAKRAAGSWNSTTANNAERALLRVFSWGVTQGILQTNPLKGVKRTRPQSRQRGLTDDEYRAMLRHSQGPLRRLLFALRNTGTRPQELRELTWEQVQADRVVIVNHKTRNTRRVRKDRVVWLTQVMQRLMAWLRRHSQSDYVFLNHRGQPWTRDALVQAVQRARERAGLAKDVVAYLCRHAWGTGAIVNGVNPAVVAELMGNSLEMVANVYVHLADKTAHLAAEMERAIRPRSA